MKKYLLYFSFCFGVFASAAAQNLNQYQYVRVPDKFEFLKEENQYKLNALTAFLFEKYGFETLYKKENPPGVDPCDILQANVHNDSNLFRSKLYISLQNCQNQTVFTSESGTSREKDFETSYHEALREAFVSIENLNYSKPTDKNAALAREKAKTQAPPEVIVDPVVSSEEIAEVAAEKNAPEAKIPSAEASKTRKFSNGPVSYRLEPTSSGFDLFKEGQQEKFASLMKSGGGDNFLYASKNVSGNAFFDRQGNLVVEYLDPNSQQLVTINYKLQAQ